MQLDFSEADCSFRFFLAFFFISLTGKNVGKKDTSYIFSCVIFTVYLEAIVLIKVDFV